MKKFVSIILIAVSIFSICSIYTHATSIDFPSWAYIRYYDSEIEYLEKFYLEERTKQLPGYSEWVQALEEAKPFYEYVIANCNGVGSVELNDKCIEELEKLQIVKSVFDNAFNAVAGYIYVDELISHYDESIYDPLDWQRTVGLEIFRNTKTDTERYAAVEEFKKRLDEMVPACDSFHSITAPMKRLYIRGEKIDYTGFKATVIASNGKEFDVTHACRLVDVTLYKTGEIERSFFCKNIRGTFSVRVTNPDANGDGAITLADVVLLAQGAIGRTELAPELVQEAAADGQTVRLADLIRISKFVMQYS